MARRALLPLALACSLLSVEALAQQPPQSGPKLVGYRTETEPRVGMIVAGSVLFGVGYLAPLSIVAAAEFPNESIWMAVPVAGPFITMARMDWNEWCSDEQPECTGKGFANAFAGIGLVLTGLMQAGGATLLIVGAATPNERVVPVYAVTPTPMGEDGAGIAVTGRF
ncbi:MAG TPA: hypothetical protein VFB62_18130 [Polyangiaceae bacterium]|jgi:hypothetical protein|nr:hypothetical protein [Polyangiaceae bacterium]